MNEIGWILKTSFQDNDFIINIYCNEEKQKILNLNDSQYKKEVIEILKNAIKFMEGNK